VTRIEVKGLKARIKSRVSIRQLRGIGKRIKLNNSINAADK